jgi:hypothetical protein
LAAAARLSLLKRLLDPDHGRVFRVLTLSQLTPPLLHRQKAGRPPLGDYQGQLINPATTIVMAAALAVSSSGAFAAHPKAMPGILRVCPETSGRIAKFSEHEAN